MFRSLSNYNYRVWFIGALVSNVGAWMQATTQNWVVLTQLTDQLEVAQRVLADAVRQLDHGAGIRHRPGVVVDVHAVRIGVGAAWNLDVAARLAHAAILAVAGRQVREARPRAIF